VVGGATVVVDVGVVVLLVVVAATAVVAGAEVAGGEVAGAEVEGSAIEGSVVSAIRAILESSDPGSLVTASTPARPTAPATTYVPQRCHLGRCCQRVHLPLNPVSIDGS
jgi:hypothetical protein